MYLGCICPDNDALNTSKIAVNGNIISGFSKNVMIIVKIPHFKTNPSAFIPKLAFVVVKSPNIYPCSHSPGQCICSIHTHTYIYIYIVLRVSKVMFLGIFHKFLPSKDLIW